MQDCVLSLLHGDRRDGIRSALRGTISQLINQPIDMISRIQEPEHLRMLGAQFRVDRTQKTFNRVQSHIDLSNGYDWHRIYFEGNRQVEMSEFLVPIGPAAAAYALDHG